MIKRIRLNKNKGFLVLTMILLVSAVVIAIVTGIMLRSVGEAKASQDTESSLKAWGAVSACGEYALDQLSTTTAGKTGWAYAGGQTLDLGTETCYIYPIETVGSAKLIKATSTVSSFTKKIKIQVATNTPNIWIDLWEEVADF